MASLPRPRFAVIPRHPDSAPSSVAPLKRQMRRWLGALWVLDGLLQLQPGMFTMAMLHNVMTPLTTAGPSWLTGLEQWAIHVMSPHVAVWNLGIAIMQLVIGGLLLSERRPQAVRVGLVVSVIWSLLVWVFGEGLGGLLNGGASMLTGAPGSVLLYGYLAVLLLLPDEEWQPRRGFHLMRDGASVFWALAALAQLTPVFWTKLGLSAEFQSNAMMQPHWFAQTINWAVVATAGAPRLANALIVGIFLILAWGSAQRPVPRWVFGLAAAALVATWWLVQGMGMVLTGMATDPNTVPLVALLMLPAWWYGRHPQPADHEASTV